MKCIVYQHLSNETNPTYSLQDAEPCHFRFLDVKSFLEENCLRIVQALALSHLRYATVSFVWHGLESGSTDSAPCLPVSGLSQEPDVSLNILSIVCRAAHRESCEYVWLDKLSVRQDTSPNGVQDTVWQVQHMYEIYGRCQVCLVLAGGLNRLNSLCEPTTWMDRCWTLQEALAPPMVKCVFAWDKGYSIIQHNGAIVVEDVIPGKVAVAELRGLLGGAIKGTIKCFSGDQLNSMDFASAPDIEIKMFGTRTADIRSMHALLGALDHDGTERREARLNAIWRCMVLRCAKLKQDLIFGTMGILGAEVEHVPGTNPKQPYSDDQLNQLLINFTQQLVAKGYSAVWLGVIPQLGMNSKMSAMPLLPYDDAFGETMDRGLEPSRLNRVKDILPEDVDMWWWLDEAPTGAVLDNGDFRFRARMAPISKDKSFWKGGYFVQRDHPDKLVQLDNKQMWTLHKDEDSPWNAILIGQKRVYLNGAVAAMVEFNATLLMLTCQRGSRHRGLGYAWADMDTASDWKESEVTVGG